MEISVPTFVIQIINFVLFALVLIVFLLKPLQRVIDERRKKIENDFEEAKEAKESAMQIKKDYEDKLKETNITSAEIIANAVTSAENTKKEIIAEANAHADRLRKRILIEAEDMKKRTYQDINKEIGSLAVSMASKILETSLEAPVHSELIEKFASKVESGNVR